MKTSLIAMAGLVAFAACAMEVETPVARWRQAPVRDPNEAIIFTMQELTTSDRALELARTAGSDLLIRGWFKWRQAPSFQPLRAIPQKAHAFGALFGGGITCSALYDSENGITHAQLLDMATRGPDGQLVDAWGHPGIRHGSLSCPVYLDYLFRWCREQIDAGVDYLFMDEINAALGPREGYDDYSLADFRHYLLDECPRTRGWSPADPRWTTSWHIDPAQRAICSDGTLNTFDYRAWLRAAGLVEHPDTPKNVLVPLWHRFREWRDDRAWKTLTERIRAYARGQSRTVFISGNGLAKYVDLQVLGVWNHWTTQAGHIELGENQLPYWRGLIQRGQLLAGRRVPVVLFHDWGFGNPPFPWLAVLPAERAVWLRTRGAEIFAAGAFFAFPVLGPGGCDAEKDGTLPVIAQQAAFYQTHRALYLKANFLGGAHLSSATPNLSLAAWAVPSSQALLLHVINRNVVAGALQAQHDVTIEMPLDSAPMQACAISPDFPGTRTTAFCLANNRLCVTLPDLDAYAVVRLEFSTPVNFNPLRDPVRTATSGRWDPSTESEFRVLPDGLIENVDELSGFIQGRLHSELRNPPTFLVNTAVPGTLVVHVRAVAKLGARLEYRIDGVTQQTVELPDRDGKNDSAAPEYDRDFRFPIPTGVHHLTLDNVGGDWASVAWYAFEGSFQAWPTGQ